MDNCALKYLRKTKQGDHPDIDYSINVGTTGKTSISFCNTFSATGFSSYHILNSTLICLPSNNSVYLVPAVK